MTVLKQRHQGTHSLGDPIAWGASGKEAMVEGEKTLQRLPDGGP